MTSGLNKLLDAANAHVVFDGWTEAVFESCAQDAGMSMQSARAICPRGAIDLAVAYHKAGDQKLVAKASAVFEADLRYSEKVAELVWLRIGLVDKEMVRRGMALFSLPAHTVEGAGLIWETADTIWKLLDDTSDDLNWYSKRAILSGVIGSTNLYWLGDSSEGDALTRAFLDRRIANVMQFEKFKANVRKNEALAPLIALQDKIMGSVSAPGKSNMTGYPGTQKSEYE